MSETKEPCLGEVVIVGTHRNYQQGSNRYNSNYSQFKTALLNYKRRERSRTGHTTGSNRPRHDMNIHRSENCGSIGTDVLSSSSSFCSSSLSSETTSSTRTTTTATATAAATTTTTATTFLLESSYPSESSVYTPIVYSRTMEIKLRLRPVMERMKASLDKIQALENSLKRSEYLSIEKQASSEEDASVKTAATSKSDYSSCASPTRDAVTLTSPSSSSSSSFSGEDKDTPTSGHRQDGKWDSAKSVATASTASVSASSSSSSSSASSTVIPYDRSRELLRTSMTMLKGKLARLQRMEELLKLSEDRQARLKHYAIQELFHRQEVSDDRERLRSLEVQVELYKKETATIRVEKEELQSIIDELTLSIESLKKELETRMSQQTLLEQDLVERQEMTKQQALRADDLEWKLEQLSKVSDELLLIVSSRERELHDALKNVDRLKEENALLRNKMAETTETTDTEETCPEKQDSETDDATLQKNDHNNGVSASISPKLEEKHNQVMASPHDKHQQQQPSDVEHKDDSTNAGVPSISNSLFRWSRAFKSSVGIANTTGTTASKDTTDSAVPTKMLDASKSATVNSSVALLPQDADTSGISIYEDDNDEFEDCSAILPAEGPALEMVERLTSRLEEVNKENADLVTYQNTMLTRFDALLQENARQSARIAQLEKELLQQEQHNKEKAHTQELQQSHQQARIAELERQLGLTTDHHQKKQKRRDGAQVQDIETRGIDSMSTASEASSESFDRDCRTPSPTSPGSPASLKDQRDWTQ